MLKRVAIFFEVWCSAFGDNQGTIGPVAVAVCPPDVTFTRAIPTLRSVTRAVWLPVRVTIAVVGSPDAKAYTIPGTREPASSTALAVI